MTKKIILTDRAPKPVGPYSQAIISGGFIFLAGQIPIDPSTGIIITEGVHKETRMIMDNISAVLEAAGSSLEKIVKLTVYLINIEDVKFVNEVLEDRIKGGFPARSAVQVSRLPKDANVEIEAIAEI
jgi:2-iminobutanoate/2-iminopropanoate deaminase